MRTAGRLSLLLMIVVLFSGCLKENIADKKDMQASKVRLKFICLAWQKTSIDAFKSVVEEWNLKNPEIHVDYIQGDWRKIGTDMLTAFDSGEVPDLLHYWASPVITWNRAGFLADLSPIVTGELRNDIDKNILDLFDYKGKMGAIPFMYEDDVIIYNKKLFKEQNITLPTLDKPWTFEQLKAAAGKLTDPGKGRYGMAIGLGQASRHLNEMFALKWGLTVVSKKDGKAGISVSPEYKSFMNEIYNLIYVDKVMSPEVLTLNPEHIAPGFVEGKYAMLPGIGCYIRSQIIEQSKGTDLEWGVLPTFKAKGQSCFSAIQTISIPEQSENKKEALEFLTFMSNSENMAKIAYGDWLFPVRHSAFNSPQFADDENGWKLARDSFKNVIIPNYVDVPGYQEFMDSKGLEIYLRYLGGKISIGQFKQQLETEGNKVLDSYSDVMGN